MINSEQFLPSVATMTAGVLKGIDVAEKGSQYVRVDQITPRIPSPKQSEQCRWNCTNLPTCLQHDPCTRSTKHRFHISYLLRGSLS